MQKYNLRNTPQEFHLIVVKGVGPEGPGEGLNNSQPGSYLA